MNNLLFSSNFATQGAQGWVVSPLGSAANWSIAHSALEYNGAGDSQIYAGNSTWTDYTVNAQFKLSTAQNWPGGIRGRVNPATGASYMLWIYPQQGQIILFKTAAWNINQSLVQLGAATASFDTSNYHTLSLSFTGTQIRALYDGNALITVTDTAYANGLVALEGDTQVIDFQSVVATASNPNSGSLASSAASLTFNGSYGGAAPAAQTVQLTAASGVLAWTASTSASWLAVSPNGGNTPGTLQISVNTAGLPPGTSNGTLSVVSFGAANSTQLIPVTVNLSTTPPSLVASPTTLNFTGLAGQAAPPAQALTISNGGFGTLSWSAASDSPWLTVSPAAGSTPGSVSASVNLSGLANGTYTGHIILAASGVANSPFSVPVTLSVLSADMTETFSDGGSGWIVSPMGLASGWTASSGVYSYNGGGASQTCTGNTAWTDYSVDANIKLSSLANWPGGIRARVNPSTGAGYLVWLYPGSGLAVLYKVGQWNVNGAQLTSLGQASVAFDATSSHDLQLAFSGSSITVAWDGHPLIQATDTAYTAGFVCLDADNRPIAYSNIRVAAVQPAIVLATPSPASLIFSALPGANPPPQNVVLGSSGGSVAWAATSSAAWLTPTLSSGFAPGSLTASVNSAGMAEGTYTATITVSAPGTTNSPLTIPVTLAVKTAVLAVAPSSLTFFGSTAANPASRTLTVQNAGSGALAWSAGVGSAWLGLSPSSGSAPGTLTVQPNTVTLATGIYSDSITVSSPDVANPASIPVALQVGTPLFSDNFSAGAGNWTISPLGNAAGWSVSNSVYSYNGAGHTQSWAGSNSWTNYTAAVNFQLASLIDYPGGLRGRVNISTGAGYTAWIYPAERVIKLFRVDQWNIDTSSALLAQSAAPSIDTGIHNLRLVFQGSTIQVYLDNVLAVTANDSTYTQGAIALDVSNQPIAFSSVDVIGF